jgi:hypothetical protein
MKIQRHRACRSLSLPFASDDLNSIAISRHCNSIKHCCHYRKKWWWWRVVDQDAALAGTSSSNKNLQDVQSSQPIWCMLCQCDSKPGSIDFWKKYCSTLQMITPPRILFEVTSRLPKDFESRLLKSCTQYWRHVGIVVNFWRLVVQLEYREKSNPHTDKCASNARWRTYWR